jgi:V/A-type H+/Na+-transporting ATPase subunit C
MNDYDVLNARVKGLSCTLLTPPFYDQILALEGIDALVDALLSSNYGPSLRETVSAGPSLKALETGLRDTLCKTYRKVLALAPARPRRLLQIQLLYWDVLNILTLCRGQIKESSTEDTVAGLFPAGELDEAKLVELAGQSDLIALADTLCTWGFPFAFALRKSLVHQTGSGALLAIENVLAREYFAWAQSEVSGSDENQSLVRGHLECQIDRVNIMSALRNVRHTVEGECVEAMPWVAQGRLTQSWLGALRNCADLDLALEMVAGTYFAPAIERGILAFGEHRRLGLVERLLEGMVLARGCRMFRSDPLGIGVAAGFLWRKFNEFLNLRILLRGKAYALPGPAIREELHIV